MVKPLMTSFKADTNLVEAVKEADQQAMEHQIAKVNLQRAKVEAQIARVKAGEKP
jgi:hypothetical protein